MEGEQARLIGARGGTSTEKVCSQEERKRRKKSGGVEEVPAGLQKHPDCSSASSISHGSHLWPIVTVLDYRLPAVKDEAEITWREMMVAEVFWMCALTPLFTRCCMVSAGMIYVQLCDDLIRFLQCSHEKGNAKELAPLSDYTFYRSWCQVSCLHLFQAGSCLMIMQNMSCYLSSYPQTTAARPAAWMWPIGWHISSRECRCKKMKSSFWRWLWLTSWRDSTFLRSTKQLLLLLLAGEHRGPKVSKDLLSYLQASGRISGVSIHKVL